MTLLRRSSSWNPDFEKISNIGYNKHLHANFSAWVCDPCEIAYVFLNSSENENTVLTLINLKGYPCEIIPCHICGNKEDISEVFAKDGSLRSGCSKCYGEEASYSMKMKSNDN